MVQNSFRIVNFPLKSPIPKDEKLTATILSLENFEKGLAIRRFLMKLNKQFENPMC